MKKKKKMLITQLTRSKEFGQGAGAKWPCLFEIECRIWNVHYSKYKWDGFFFFLYTLSRLV